MLWAYTWGGLYSGGAYSRRFTVIHKTVTYFVPNFWRYLHIDILYTLDSASNYSVIQKLKP
jgi:hypothetical protein